MTESVYQKPRRMLNAGTGWTAGTCDAVLAALEAGEKAEAERDSLCETVAELQQKLSLAETEATAAEQAAFKCCARSAWGDGEHDANCQVEALRERVRELEMVFKRMTLIKNVGGEGSTIAVIDFPAIEKVLGPEVLGQVPKPKDPK